MQNNSFIAHKVLARLVGRTAKRVALAPFRNEFLRVGITMTSFMLGLVAGALCFATDLSVEQRHLSLNIALVCAGIFSLYVGPAALRAIRAAYRAEAARYHQAYKY